MKMYLRAALLSTVGLLACSPANKVGTFEGDSTQKPVEDISDAEVLIPKVDILFVIDNSWSMDFHQNNLARNIDRFVGNFSTSSSIDFHIGVINTDNDKNYGECCGRLIGNPNFVELTTPDLSLKLKQRLIVGTDGSAKEKVFDPIYAALTPPNLDDYNKGFLRADAFLAIVIITDAEDSSVFQGPDASLGFLSTLKGSKDRVLAYGAIIPSSVKNCQRDEVSKTPIRIEKFLNTVATAGKNTFSLCDQNYGDELAKVGADLAKRVSKVFILKRIPVVDTIALYFGTQEIPSDELKGWTFNAKNNSIELGPDIEWTDQPEGTKMRITYEPTKFE